MKDNEYIVTTKTIYPQIYAYTLPNRNEDVGWIKIGYTERKNVDTRIKEQTRTAAFKEKYIKLWSEPAKYNGKDIWFTDHKFHCYLTNYKKIKRRYGTEWFYFNGTPEKSYDYFLEFINSKSESNQEYFEYVLRPEQSKAVRKTIDYINSIQENDNSSGIEDNRYLWNAKPRFGKTLAAYDLMKKIEAKNILIVTNRPSISTSWFNDYEKFISWNTDYKFISTTDSLNDSRALNRNEFINLDDINARQITFISLQDLKGSVYFGGSYDKLEWISELNWDLLIVDESHEGVDTFKTETAFDRINRNFTLYLSGTPFKALASGEFSNNQIFNWTYVDEREAKEKWKYSNGDNPYEDLPRLNLFSYQMSKMIKDEINKGAQINGNNVDYAFDLNEFFETNEHGNFVHESDVKEWINTLSNNEKYPFSTERLRNEIKHSLWILNRVSSAKALKKLLQKNTIFKDYYVVLAVGDVKETLDNFNHDKNSYDRVRNAIENNDKTITLSVGQLTTGVTIPEWTAVMMLSNISSPSLYLQAAFRSQSKWEYELNKKWYKKDNAYIFDFSPERTLIMYDDLANGLYGNKDVDDNVVRRKNIEKLVNFFPVISEDNNGKMKQLDVNQILTIPKHIKATEVVRHGFMSNLLFQNISGVFASNSVINILENMKPAKKSESNNRKINTKNIKLNNNGDPDIDEEVVVNTNNANFGPKIFEKISNDIEKTLDDSKFKSKSIIKIIKKNTEKQIQSLYTSHNLTTKKANNIISHNSKIIERVVNKISKNKEIDNKKEDLIYRKKVSKLRGNQKALDEAKKVYKDNKNTISNLYKDKMISSIDKVSKDITKETTRKVLFDQENDKKQKVENDIRDRLRGFSRTIPSFLMAYGNYDTTLQNFDKSIKNTVFKEVTGINLDQFRTLRDDYHLFDEIVFNESIKQFMDKRISLSNYFENDNEDIFDYIPPQSTNQIYTPRNIVKMMLDKLEQEDIGVFKNPNVTFIDLYVKSGLYLAEIIKRLYKGLENKYPNEKIRLKHILENQVFGFAPTEIIYKISHNYIYGFDHNDELNDSHFVYLDTKPYAMGEVKDKDGEKITFIDEVKNLFRGETVKFDIAIGNPPYHEDSGGSSSDKPVYNFFYDLSEQIADKYSLITPARFLSLAGGTSINWDEKMLNDPHLKVVYYESDSKKVFSNTGISGGVVVVYRDKYKNYGKIGFFTSFQQLNIIAQKINSYGTDSIKEYISGRGIYHLTDKALEDHPEIIEIQSKGHKRDIGTGFFTKFEDIISFKKKPNDDNDYIKLFGLFNNNRTFRWIKSDYVNRPKGFDNYKVIIPKAYGKPLSIEKATPILGGCEILEPNVAFTETFISINCSSKEEAENLLKYLKTKFVRILLAIRKVTQDNTKNKWTFVPLQNFSDSSDINWNVSIDDINKQLYEKYDIESNDIKFINKTISSIE